MLIAFHILAWAGLVSAVVGIIMGLKCVNERLYWTGVWVMTGGQILGVLAFMFLGLNFAC